MLAVSWARSGDTSSDTHPSTPSVFSQIGRNRSAARVMSASASSKNSASLDVDCSTLRRMDGVIRRAVLDRVVEDRRIRRESRHRELVDVVLERAGCQQVACDVIEPDALAQIVEICGCFHADFSAIDAKEEGEGTKPDRLDMCVRSRSHPKGAAASISSVHRQRQLPAGLPGTFIRACAPRLSTSCKGAMASAAWEDHARPSSAGAAARRRLPAASDNAT